MLEVRVSTLSNDVDASKILFVIVVVVVVVVVPFH